MPDLSAKPGGSFSFAAALMSQSLIMVNVESFQSHVRLSMRQFLLLLDEGVMDYFQHQSPLVQALVPVAVTAGWTGGPFPGQHLVQRPAQQRFLGGNVFHEPFRIIEIFAHGLVTRVAGNGRATGLDDTVLLRR